MKAKDKFGKPIKVGQDVLYADVCGHNMRRGTVAAIVGDWDGRPLIQLNERRLTAVFRPACEVTAITRIPMEES
jgi:hypothetical protein